MPCAEPIQTAEPTSRSLSRTASITESESCYPPRRGPVLVAPTVEDSLLRSLKFLRLNAHARYSTLETQFALIVGDMLANPVSDIEQGNPRFSVLCNSKLAANTQDLNCTLGARLDRELALLTW